MWPCTKIGMVKPAAFGYNAQTAVTNSFQQPGAAGESKKALEEFNSMVSTLKHNGIDVLVIEDTASPVKPDAIFPNNWFSTHLNNTCLLYPMLHQNRRMERRADIIKNVTKPDTRLIDLSYLEASNLFLEGTGSLVIDHDFNIAYAVVSPRTSTKALAIFEEKTGIKVHAFHAYDKGNLAIYHTNVVMALSPTAAVVCMEAIPAEEHINLKAGFEKTNKELIEISLTQLENFAGNMLCLQNAKKEHLLIMSQTAYNSLDVDQIDRLSKSHKLVSIAIPTIEKIGGGSVRCMMAELF